MTQPRAFARRAWRALGTPDADITQLLSKLVRNAPEARLEQLMRTPARRVILDGIVWQLPQQLDPSLPQGIDASIRLCVTTPQLAAPDTYSIVIAQRRSRVTRGDSGPTPHITVTVDSAEFLRLLTGNSSPVGSYFAGKLKLTGDIVLAIRLIGELRLPAADTVSRKLNRGRFAPGSTAASRLPTPR
ncbi:MAG: SCP2 sterol-binding domain-containing protein [Solirubrobacteraceae bacterium]